MNQPHVWKKKVLAGVISLGAVSMVGCTSHGRDAVPSDARTLTTGEGRELVSATAPHDGEMYVVDDTDNKLVWSGQVHRDDRIEVDGEAKAIKHNGRTASDAHVHRDHRYVIKFYRDRG